MVKYGFYKRILFFPLLFSFHSRTYNQLWGRAQNEIQTVLSNESQAYIGKSEKVGNVLFLKIENEFIVYYFCNSPEPYFFTNVTILLF